MMYKAFQKKWLALFAFSFPLLLGGGDVHAGLFDDTEARKQIAQTNQRVESTQAELSRFQLEMQANQQKLSDQQTALKEQLNARLDSLNLLELQNQLAAAKADNKALRGQLEELQYKLDNSEKRNKDLYADQEARLRALEEAASRAVPAAPEVQNNEPIDQTAYQAALTLYKQGDYRGAAAGFGQFLKDYPSSTYADNALYWRGFSYAALREHKEAISLAQQLLKQYPDSAKAPDALLLIGNSYAALKDKPNAKKYYQQLVQRYPDSTAATQAKSALTQLR